MKKKRHLIHAGSFKPGNTEHKRLHRDEKGRFLKRENAVVPLEADEIKKIEVEVDKLLE